MKKMARNLCLLVFILRGQLESMRTRAIYNEIGCDGRISEADREVAKVHRLKPLSDFERWLLKPFIASETKRRSLEAFPRPPQVGDG